MISTPSRAQRLLPPLFVLGVLAVAVWLWVSLCLFPVSVWNDVRLAPSLALAQGVPFYTDFQSGAATTWMYGPLPVLLWLPAALAPSAGSAVFTAGVINALSTLAALAATCLLWPAPAAHDPGSPARWAAFLLVVAVWPFAAWQYLQADNLAVALGLAGNLIAVRRREPAAAWLAAACAVGAVACKQTSLGVAAAQVVWFACTGGWRAGLAHGARCAGCAAAVAVAMLAVFPAPALLANTFFVPGSLPWAPDPVRRVTDMAPELLVQIALPALALLVFRRGIWRRDSVILLPSLAWLCELPPNAAAFMKYGGTLNSLHGFQLWLPVAALVLLARPSSRQTAVAALLAICLAVGLCAARVARLQTLRWTPALDHYRQAAQIARLFPAQIWFPWNPLVTIYADGRFDHVEDGLCMRILAGRPPSPDLMRRHLPPDMHVIALPRGGTDWGVALHEAPPDARVEPAGLWVLHRWKRGSQAEPSIP